MRVRQAIEDQGQSHVATLTRFTSDLDKGKGHVFSYPEPQLSPRDRIRSTSTVSLPLLEATTFQSDYSESECSGTADILASTISTGFQIGVSTKTQLPVIVRVLRVLVVVLRRGNAKHRRVIHLAKSRRLQC